MVSNFDRRAIRYESLWDRLVANIRIELDHWIWVGPTRRHGSGYRPAVSMRCKASPYPRNYNAARLMCREIHGEPPTPMHEASHLCNDEYLCICPDHLIWETRKENMARHWIRRRAEAVADIHERGEVTTECPF